MSAKVLRYLRILYYWQVRKDLVLNYLPEEISIEVTNVCNFKCAFCPQSDPKHHELVPRSYLSPAGAEKILSNLRSGGVRTKTLHWTLDGDPFMNKRFHELCAVAVAYDFKNMYFATNGMLLTDDVLMQLPNGPGVRYTFTIDFAADPVYFEKVRGTKDSWERIRSNIQYILDSENWKHLYIEVSDISTYQFSDHDEVKKRFKLLQELFIDPHGRLKVFSKTFHNATGLVSKLVSGTPGKRYHLCPYPWTSLFVASNGDVVACCRDLRRQTVLGNLMQQNLAEIWNSEAFQVLRTNLVERHPEKSTACNGCDLPFDDTKFSWRNVIRAARGRFQIFEKTFNS
jgi:radical SAM protein with 4Fe4S-binding SPASM domain